MATRYKDPQGRRHARIPRSFRLKDGTTGSLPVNPTDAQWTSLPDCTIETVPDPVPVDRAEQMAPYVQPIRALLTAAGIAKPTNFGDAVTSIKRIPDKIEMLSVGLELLTLRIALVEHGGTWEDV